jgi:pimeloyl-ACP methyl ester carboxylesterase
MRPIYKSEKGRAEVEAKYREILAFWPVANTQKTVPTREGDTFVIASGPENAPPLLLLHGSAANASSFIGDVATWSKAFRVYAIDMIGEPGFSAPSRPRLASDRYVLWLDDVLSALSLTRISIVGISLGGWLALNYATERPERIEKLALLCPGGIGRQKNFLRKALPLMLLGPWGARKVREMVFGKASAATSPLQGRMRDFMQSIFANFRPRIERLPVYSDDALKRLTMPVLAIVGGRDALLDSEDTKRRLARNVPQADIRYLPEVYHYIPGQTEAIFDFLSKAH